MQLEISTIVLHLSLIGVSPRVCALLINHFGDRLHVVYTMTGVELAIETGISPDNAEKIVQGLSDKVLLHKELYQIDRHEISWVTLVDNDYPEILRHIHAPPPVLYYQGVLSVLSKTIAFVGSRKADTYGQQVVNELVPPLAQAGFACVSGGALGIDSMVHKAALQVQGITVAVLGSGLLQPYPASNKELFKKIIYSGGVVMSPFCLSAAPLPLNFLARNRIIAGLCPATIIVQAASKSGALVTARHALHEGREVGAVPGSLFNELSSGCHNLIAQGARLISNVNDIYELLGVGQRYALVSGAKKIVNQVRERDPLLALCLVPQTIDDLIIKSGFPYDLLQERLWQLQVEGRIEQNMIGLWQTSE